MLSWENDTALLIYTSSGRIVIMQMLKDPQSSDAIKHRLPAEIEPEGPVKRVFSPRDKEPRRATGVF